MHFLFITKVIPWEVTEEKDNDDTNKDPGQVHFVTGFAVPVCPHMGVLDPLNIRRDIMKR